MATVTGLTAERMLEIEANSVVDGEVVAGNLILSKHDGSEINAGSVIGPAGPEGPSGQGVEYEGAWSAGTAYLPGDIVTHEGVEYIAVNPSTGEEPPAAEPLQIARRSCRAKQATPQSLPTGNAGTVVTLDGEDWDTDNIHSNVTNNSRLTIPADLGGIWLFVGSMEMPNPGSAARAVIGIRKNGTTLVAIGGVSNNQVGASNRVWSSVSFQDLAVPGDYYEAIAFSDYGVSQNIVSASLSATRLAV